MTERIQPAACAKLVRRALAEAFPGVKFSVRTRTYAGGASVDVRWIDGPHQAAVEAVAGRFEGATFDGMTDYKGHKEHTLEGRPVRFAADWVHCARAYSPAFLAECLAAARDYYAGYEWPACTIATHRDGTAYLEAAGAGMLQGPDGQIEFASQLVHRIACKRGLVPALPSATAASVALVRAH